MKTVLINDDYQIDLDNEMILFSCIDVSFDALLPEAALMVDKIVYFKKLDDTGIAAGIVPYLDERIDGLTQLTVILKNSVVAIRSNGTSWNRII